MTDKSSRREFLQATAVAAVAGKTVPLEAGSAEGSPGPGAPRDRVRFGMIGVGMQGSGLLGTSVSIQGTECAAACDLYDGRHALGLPQAAREKYYKEWHQAHDPKPGQEPLRDVVSYKGPSYDEVRPHLERFFRAVRTRQGIVQDAVFGNHAARACHMANESYFRGGPVRLDPATKSLKG